MEKINILRNTAIISYLLIILMGQIIGIPFIIWLLWTAIDFGNTDQIFAVSGLLGVSLNMTRWKNKVFITILSFMMMLLPTVSRMMQIPIKQFNYLAFGIPLLIFFVCYLIFIILNIKKEKRVVSL